MTAIVCLADYGEFFATRARAREIREALPAGEPVILDFTGVAGMTISFGDELIGRLLAAGRQVFADGDMSDDIRQSVETVCRRRGLSIPHG